MSITLSGSGITSANIADGTIVNADINSSAAIAASKLTGTGKLLQTVKFVEDSSSMTVSTTTYTDTNLSVSITPTSTSSKILIMWNMQGEFSSALHGYGVKLLRDSTAVFTSTTQADVYNSGANAQDRASWMHLDSPSTISSITYKVQVGVNTGTIYFNGNHNKTQLILMEIGV